MFDIEGFVYRNFDDTVNYGDPVSDIRVNCPYCDDAKHHLYISLVKQTVHCFKCGYSRNWVGFVMDITGQSYWMAVGELYRKTSLASINKTPEPILKGNNSAELPEDFQNLLLSEHPLAMHMRYYLDRRGFGDAYIRRYNLGIAPSISARIIIPIEGAYWQGRRLYSWMTPKYINPKADAKGVIFNSDALYDYSEVVVCEGAFSAMAVGQNAVALIGKEPTREKTARLIAAPAERFIITIEPGANTMYELADKLQRNGKKVMLWKYNSGDPADGEDYEKIDWNFRNKVKILLN